MRQHVDEAGRYRQAFCIDNDRRRRATEISDGCNAITLDSDIVFYRRTTGAIVNRAVSNDAVE